MKAEVWLLSWDFQPRWSAPANKGFCRPKSGCTLCSDFFQYWLGLGLGLIMRICEDCDRAVPTTWYFHFVITRCSLLLPSIMILNRQTPSSFLSSSNPKGWTTRGSDNGAYQSSCTAARSIFPGNVGGPTGACRAIIYHTKILENRGTKWHTQNKRRAKRGQASTQALVF